MSEHHEISEHHLAACGVDNECRLAAASLGISGSKLLELIIKYGPVVMAVLKDLLAQKEGRPIRPI